MNIIAAMKKKAQKIRKYEADLINKGSPITDRKYTLELSNTWID